MMFLWFLQHDLTHRKLLWSAWSDVPHPHVRFSLVCRYRQAHHYHETTPPVLQGRLPPLLLKPSRFRRHTGDFRQLIVKFWLNFFNEALQCDLVVFTVSLVVHQWHLFSYDIANFAHRKHRNRWNSLLNSSTPAMFAAEDFKNPSSSSRAKIGLKAQFFDRTFQFFKILRTNRIGVPGIRAKVGNINLQNRDFYIHFIATIH